MNNTTAPTYTQTQAGYLFLVDELNRTLPRLDGSPERQRKRFEAMIERATCLRPVDQTEAAIAARFVAADAQASDTLRCANDPETAPGHVGPCILQAALMLRHSQSAMRQLLKAQAARKKRAAHARPIYPAT